jgi:hypothetical protein
MRLVDHICGFFHEGAPLVIGCVGGLFVAIVLCGIYGVALAIILTLLNEIL